MGSLTMLEIVEGKLAWVETVKWFKIVKIVDFLENYNFTSIKNS